MKDWITLLAAALILLAMFFAGLGFLPGQPWKRAALTQSLSLETAPGLRARRCADVSEGMNLAPSRQGKTAGLHGNNMRSRGVRDSGKEPTGRESAVKTEIGCDYEKQAVFELKEIKPEKLRIFERFIWIITYSCYIATRFAMNRFVEDGDSAAEGAIQTARIAVLQYRSLSKKAQKPNRSES